MEKINVGLVGAGRIAGHHIRSIRKLKKLKIVSICDLDIDKAKFYGDKYKINIYSHYDEMLKNEKKIDLVVIMTPSGMHFTHSMDILKKYKKNLVIEKPTCMKTSQVTKLFKLAKASRTDIFPVFQNRYNKCIRKLKNELNKNKLGKIRIVNLTLRWCRPQRYYDLSVWRGTFSHDGGALTNQGIHFIDLLRYLFGNIKFLQCKMKTLGVKIEVEDTIVSTLEFESGAIGNLEVTTSVRPQDDGAFIYVAGSKGNAKIGGLSANILESFSLNQKYCKKFSEKIPDPYGFGHDYIYKQIIETLVSKKEFPVSYDDCFKTTQLLNAFYISDEKNKKINVLKAMDSKRLGRKNDKISKLYR